ncbi:hypothetical protein GQ457_12G015430 [Hibiscus cannabinus]
MNVVHVRDQKHELTPPRNRYPCDNGNKKVTAFPPRDIVYKQDNQLSRHRDKPITHQDALPKSEDPAEISAWTGPVVSSETSPLSSYLGRLSKHSYR